MKRFDAINRITEILTEEFVVCNIGIPSKELFHLKDRPQNFYMMGSMGLASSIALGLASWQSKHYRKC
jgi:sulfopyruvate decarboxylase subunit beta